MDQKMNATQFASEKPHPRDSGASPEAQAQPQVYSGEIAHLTKRPGRPDNPGQSGSVCLDEIRGLARSCVQTQDAASEEEALQKLVYLYGAADPQRNASKTTLLRRYLEVGSASAAAEELQMAKRTARRHVEGFRRFAVDFLKRLHQSRAESEEAVQATAQKREAQKKKSQRDFDAAWVQCRTQCPRRDKHRQEVAAVYGKNSEPRPEDIGTGGPFWERSW